MLSRRERGFIGVEERGGLVRERGGGGCYGRHDREREGSVLWCWGSERERERDHQG